MKQGIRSPDNSAIRQQIPHHHDHSMDICGGCGAKFQRTMYQVCGDCLKKIHQANRGIGK